MAEAELKSTLDMQDVLKHHVILNIKLKGATWALRRLLGLMWFLRLLAWIGGVKEVIFDGEYDTASPMTEMDADIAAWNQQGRVKPAAPPQPVPPKPYTSDGGPFDFWNNDDDAVFDNM